MGGAGRGQESIRDHKGVPQDYAEAAGACRRQPLLVSPPTRIVVAVSPDAKGVEAAKAAERPSAEITTGA